MIRIALSLAIIFSTSCTAGGESLFIVANAALDDSCDVSASKDNFLVSGLLDAQSTEYIVRPVLENRALAGEVDTVNRSAFLNLANVSLVFADGFLTDAEVSSIADYVQFSVPISGVVQPSGGLAAIPIVAIRQPVLDVIAPKLATPTDRTLVQVQIEIIAELNGNEQTTNQFLFPVSVCAGCLVTNIGSCDAVGTTYEAPCETQDAILRCCTGDDGMGGTVEVCPAAPTT